MGSIRCNKKTRSDRRFKSDRENKILEETKWYKIENIRKLIIQKKINFVKQNIDNYLEEYGEDCYIIHELGKYYDEIKECDTARNYYIKNINNNGDNKYYSMYELAKLEKLKHNYTNTINLLNKIINSDHKEKIHAKIELSKVYAEMEKYHDAEKILNSIINNELIMLEKNESYSKYLEIVYNELIQIKIFTNKINQAEKLYSYIHDKINHDRSIFIKGQILQAKGKTFLARKIYEDLLTKKLPFDKSIKIQLINLEYNDLNYSRVIELGQDFINEKKYYYYDTLIYVTNCYIKEKNEREVFNCINLLEEEKYYDAASFLKGKFLFYKNDYNKSLKYFDSVSNEDRSIYRESIYRKICCYIKLNKLSDAYSLINDLKKANYNKTFDSRIHTLELYLEKMLNIDSSIKPMSYKEYQIIDYNYDMAIKHIKEFKNDTSDNNNHSLIFENINIEELYLYCLKKINKEYFYKNLFTDEYIIPYENAGYDNYGPVNYVKVVTLPNSKDIITIYPIRNWNIKQNENNKIKKISRIDKFNEKYNLNI
jgi:lipopolysaccharide biosynthesis regulator YciM